MISFFDTEFGKDKIPRLVVKDNFKCDVTPNSPREVVDAVNQMFDISKKAEERMYQLTVDAHNQIKGVFEVGHGGWDYCVVDMKNMISNALLSGATGMILVHNHPSGDVTESPEDRNLHERVTEACKLMNIKYLDFLIVGEDMYGTAYRSFREDDEQMGGAA